MNKLLFQEIENEIKASNNEKAVNLIEKILEKEPENVDAIHQLALIKVNQGDLVEAKRLLEKAIKLSQDDAILLNHLANVLLNLNDLNEAENCFIKALKISQNSPQILNNYGLLLYQASRFQEAEEKFTLALKNKTDYYSAMYNLALTLSAQEKNQEAVNHLIPLIKVQPKHLRAQFLLGKILIKEKLYKDADKHFQEIVKIQPNDKSILSSIINLLLENSRYEEAKRYCKLLLKLEPKNVETHYDLGLIAQSLGNRKRAIEYYHAALQIDESYFPAINNIALVYLAEHNPDAAKYYLTLGCELQPNNIELKQTFDALSQKSETNDEFNKIQQLFDSVADHYDEQLLTALEYQIPTRLMVLLKKYHPKNAKWNILEIGCGTGILCSYLKPWAELITGVDLSPKMSEKAKEKSCYEEVVVSENGAFLRDKEALFDLIVSADVFVYQKELEEILSACYKGLKKKGIMAFTTEISRKEEVALQPSGRYCHSKQYLKKLAKKIGFKVLFIKKLPTRTQQKGLMLGFYVLFQKK